jgi:hypothetical protein
MKGEQRECSGVHPIVFPRSRVFGNHRNPDMQVEELAEAV